jgi:hypothetical protein
MRKTLICVAAIATVAVPSAVADAAKKPKPKPTKPYCVPKNEGYKATGTLVSDNVTQTAGADTAKRNDDRYSGEAVVNITKANHKGLTGEQTLAFTNIKVKFHPGKGFEPAAGDRVKLSGKVTVYGKKCVAPGPSVVTVKKADVKQAKVNKA